MSDVTDRLRTSKDEKRKLSKEVLQKSTKLGTLEKQVCFYVKLDRIKWTSASLISPPDGAK